MNNQPIGVFDSGVGGLSILSEVKKKLPKENYIFLADQAHVPYGEKTGEELKILVSKIIDFFIRKKVKMVIFGCNTATVYAIDFLRKRYPIPLVGVVPVIKTLAEHTVSNKVGVLSTPATSKSPYLKKLINEFANGIKIYNVGGNGLENLVEEGKIDDQKTKKVLSEILTPMIKKGVDCIGLGCTHYPFLKDEIQKIVGSKISIFDSGKAVAKRVDEVLSKKNIKGNKRTGDLYYTTGDPKEFKRVAEKLLSHKLDNVSTAII
ncbi:MAG: glutamate racemase [Patescibacteria group bacterium]|nr:glutamate racemase [Patescibacteria group bacterium]